MVNFQKYGEQLIKEVGSRVKPNLESAITGLTKKVAVPSTTTSVNPAPVGKMGIVVANIAKEWRLQRNYLWEVRLPSADGLEVSKFCQNVQFGDYSMASPSTIRYGAFQAHYAGYLNVPNVTMTFLRPIPDIVTPYFHNWRAKIVDDVGFFHPKSEYAETMFLYMFDNDGAETGKIRFHNAFPNEFPGYDLSYNSNDIVKLKVTFQIDRIYFE